MNCNIIKDGTGTGMGAKVGDFNRLHTHSLSATTANVASSNGDVFNVGSEIINFSDDTKTALLYLKNNEESDISITFIFLNLGTPTGTTSSGRFSFTLNPSTGTLVDNQVEAQCFNRRLGDAQTLNADCYQGVEGDTITNGTEIELPVAAGGAFESQFVLPKGASMSMSYTPPTGNTSMDVSMSVIIIRDYVRYTTE